MVELEAVAIDDARLQRLLQLYMHEWSALISLPIGEDGLYVYDDVPLYRQDASRGVYLLVDAGERRVPVGFALTMRDDGGRRHVEDFFVIAGARRRGVGTTAAERLFALAPGPWTLTVRPENPRALVFWRAAVRDAVETLEPGDDGITRTRFAFMVAPRP